MNEWKRKTLSVGLRVSVIHWHCSAQLSMFNMEKRYRNKIIIIIIIILWVVILTFGVRFYGG